MLRGLGLWLGIVGALGMALALHGCAGSQDAGPSRGKVGTFFFFWHDCLANSKPNRFYPFSSGPYNNCAQSDFVYHPLQMTSGNVRYSSLEQGWYEAELQKIKLAGIDYVFPVYWGEHRVFPFFTTRNLTFMVQAADRIGSDIKIGLFDDTSSQVAAWNYDNGRSFEAYPPMNLADQSLWPYFYEGKIQPFFRAIPKRMWATHNGQPAEKGGRPIIITWIAKADDANPDGPSYFAFHGASASLWHWVKERFKAEFGVEPVIIFEHTWYREAPDLDGVGDAEYSWGAAAFHSIWYERNNYVVSSVGAGYDDRLVRHPGRHRPRNVTHGLDGVETQGDSLSFFRNEYLLDQPIPNWPHHGVRKDSDLVLIETWNELFEGSGIEPMGDFPDLQRPGQKLAPDAYTAALRELKKDRPGYRDWDHTLAASRRNQNGTWTLTVRNDGATAWAPGSVELGWRIHDAQGKSLAEGSLAGLGGELAFGQSQELTFQQPAEWTDTARFPQAAVVIDMKTKGTWFTDLGDGFLTRAVQSSFPGFF